MSNFLRNRSKSIVIAIISVIALSLVNLPVKTYATEATSTAVTITAPEIPGTGRRAGEVKAGTTLTFNIKVGTGKKVETVYYQWNRNLKKQANPSTARDLVILDGNKEQSMDLNITVPSDASGLWELSVSAYDGTNSPVWQDISYYVIEANATYSKKDSTAPTVTNWDTRTVVKKGDTVWFEFEDESTGIYKYFKKFTTTYSTDYLAGATRVFNEAGSENTPVRIEYKANNVGTYYFQVYGYDGSGNMSIGFVKTYEVREELTPPQINLDVNTTYIQVNKSGTKVTDLLKILPNPTLSDKDDDGNTTTGNIALAVTTKKVSPTVNTDTNILLNDYNDGVNGGKYEVTYTATDASGNQSTKTITVNLVDYTSLDELIGSVTGDNAPIQSDYKKEAWDNFAAALQTAKDTKTNNKSNQTEINNVEKALQDAITALGNNINKIEDSKKKEDLDPYKDLNPDDYKDYTDGNGNKETSKDIIDKIEDLIDKAEKEELPSEYEKILDEIKDEYDKLKKKDINTSELDAFYSLLTSLDANDYDDASKTKLQNTINALTTLKANKDEYLQSKFNEEFAKIKTSTTLVAKAPSIESVNVTANSKNYVKRGDTVTFTLVANSSLDDNFIGTINGATVNTSVSKDGNNYKYTFTYTFSEDKNITYTEGAISYTLSGTKTVTEITNGVQENTTKPVSKSGTVADIIFDDTKPTIEFSDKFTTDSNGNTTVTIFVGTDYKNTIEDVIIRDNNLPNDITATEKEKYVTIDLGGYNKDTAKAGETYQIRYTVTDKAGIQGNTITKTIVISNYISGIEYVGYKTSETSAYIPGTVQFTYNSNLTLDETNKSNIYVKVKTPSDVEENSGTIMSLKELEELVATTTDEITILPSNLKDLSLEEEHEIEITYTHKDGDTVEILTPKPTFKVIIHKIEVNTNGIVFNGNGEGSLYTGSAQEISATIPNEIVNDVTVSYTYTKTHNSDGTEIPVADRVSQSAAPTDAGTYEVTATISTKDDYHKLVGNGVSVDGTTLTKTATLKINPVPVTITIANVSSNYGSRVLGTSDFYCAVTEGNVSLGTLGINLSLVEEEVSNAGTYHIKGTWTNKNYDVTFKGEDGTSEYGIYTINKCNVTVTIKEKLESTYGDNSLVSPVLGTHYVINNMPSGKTDLNLNLVVVDDNGNEVAAYTTNGDKKTYAQAKDYKVKATWNETNYNVAIEENGNNKYTINPKTVELEIANDRTSVYRANSLDSLDGVATLKSGFSYAEGDDFSDLGASLKIMTKGESAQEINTEADAGEYEIRIVSWTNKNYKVVHTPGNYVITPRDIEVTLGKTTSVYGEEINKNINITGYSLNLSLFGNQDLGLTFKVVEKGAGANANEISMGAPVGEYDVEIAGKTNNNFNVTLNKVPYEITKRPVKVTISPEVQSSIYGTTPNEITFICDKKSDYTDGTVSGLYGTDTLTGLTFKTDATNTSAVGEYGISEKTATTNANYEVSYTNLSEAKYRITAEELEDNDVTVQDVTTTYDGTPKEVTVSFPTGKTGTAALTYENTLTGVKTTEAPSTAGTYNVTIVVTGNGNYGGTITKNAILTINKATPVAGTNFQNPTDIELKAIYNQTLADVKYKADGENWVVVPTTGIPSTFTSTDSNIQAVAGKFVFVKASTEKVGNASEEGNPFDVIFVPEDSTNYNTVSGLIVKVKVEKMTPVVGINFQNPTDIELKAIYNQTLADVKYKADGENWVVVPTTGIPSTFTSTDSNIQAVAGKFVFVKISTEKVGNATNEANGNTDGNSFDVKFVPNDSANYNTVETGLTVKVKVDKKTPVKGEDFVDPSSLNLTATFGQYLEEILYNGNKITTGEGENKVTQIPNEKENGIGGYFTFKDFDPSVKTVGNATNSENGNVNGNPYTVIFTPSDEHINNYTTVETELNVNVMVAKKEQMKPVITLEKNANVTNTTLKGSNGVYRIEVTEDVPTIRLNTPYADTKATPITYSSSNPNVVTVANDGTLTFGAVGSVEITVTFGETPNYSANSSVLYLTLDLAGTLSPNFFTITTDAEPVNPQDQTVVKYAKREITVTVTPDSTKGIGRVTQVYYINAKDAELDDAGNITNKEAMTTDRPTNAGTYYIAVDLEAGSVYTAQERFVISDTLVISKIAPSLTDLNYTITDAEYDGTAKQVTVTKKDGLVGFGDFEVIYNGDNLGTDTYPTNAGTYAVVVKVEEGDNYTGATLELGNLTISEKSITENDVEVTLPTTWDEADEDKDYDYETVYNGEVQKLTSAIIKTGITGVIEEKYYFANGTNADGSIKWQAFGENEYPQNAGLYKAVVISNGTVNYTGTVTLEYTYKITPRQITFKIDDKGSIYGDKVESTTKTEATSPSALVVAEDLNTIKVNYNTYKEDKTELTGGLTTATPAGTYIIKGTIAADSNKNYDVTILDGTYVIEAKEIENVEVIVPEGELIYNEGTTQAVTVKVNGVVGNNETGIVTEGSGANSTTEMASYTLTYYKKVVTKVEGEEDRVEWETVNGIPTNAGTYKGVVVVTGLNNYTTVDKEDKTITTIEKTSEEYTINKKDQANEPTVKLFKKGDVKEEILPAEGTNTYTLLITNENPVIEVTNMTQGVGTVTFKSNDEAKVTVTPNAYTDGTENVVEIVGLGETTIEVTFPGDENYNSKSTTIKVKVIRETGLQDSFFEINNKDTEIYKGEPIAADVTVVKEGVGEITKVWYHKVADDGTVAETGTQNAIDAGTYVIKLEVEDGTKYEGTFDETTGKHIPFELDKRFVISKKSLEVAIGTTGIIERNYGDEVGNIQNELILAENSALVGKDIEAIGNKTIAEYLGINVTTEYEKYDGVAKDKEGNIVADGYKIIVGEADGTEGKKAVTAENTNYDITFNGAKIVVKPVDISVRVMNPVRTYGDSNLLSINDFKVVELLNNGETTKLVGEDAAFASDLRELLGITLKFDTETEVIKPEEAGEYKIVKATGAENPNYNVTFKDGKYTINPREITVKADDTTSVYGEALNNYNEPVNAPTRLVLVGDKTLAPSDIVLDNEVDITNIAELLGITLKTDATSTSDVGPYDITAETEIVDGEDTGIIKVTNKNYSVTFEKGTHRITPKEITVIADDKRGSYGATIEDLTLSLAQNSSLTQKDEIAKPENQTYAEYFGITLGTTATSTSDVGIYPITLADGTASGVITTTKSNYKVTFESGNYTIIEKVITQDDVVVSGNEDVTYKENTPRPVTVTVEGIVGVNGKVNKPNGDEVANYTVTYSKKVVTKVEGAEDVITWERVEGVPQDAGTYRANVEVTGAGNYTTVNGDKTTVVIENYEFTIKRQEIVEEDLISVTPIQGTIYYDGEGKAVEVVYNTNKTISVQKSYSKYDMTQNKYVAFDGVPENAGTYRAEVTISGEGNYTGTVTDDKTTYVIEKRPVTIKVNDIPETTFAVDTPTSSELLNYGVTVKAAEGLGEGAKGLVKSHEFVPSGEAPLYSYVLDSIFGSAKTYVISLSTSEEDPYGGRIKDGDTDVTENYSITLKSGRYTVKPKEITENDIVLGYPEGVDDLGNPNAITYDSTSVDGKGVAVSVTNVPNTNYTTTIKYYEYDENSETGAKENTESSNAPKNVGKYIAKVVVVGKNNYSGTVTKWSKPYEIVAASLVPGEDFTAPEDIVVKAVYGDKLKDVWYQKVETVEGNTNTTWVKGLPEGFSFTDADDTSVGDATTSELPENFTKETQGREFAAKYTPTSTNYKEVTGLAIKVIVEKATPVMGTDYINPETLELKAVYNEKLKDVKYKVSQDAEVEEDNWQTVPVSGIPNTKALGGTFTFNIDTTDSSYEEELANTDVGLATNITNGNADGNERTVIYTPADTNNYKSVTTGLSVKIMVDKAEQAAPKLYLSTGNNPVKLTGEVPTIERLAADVGPMENGDVIYGIKTGENTGIITVDENGISSLDRAGTTVITVIYSATANYKASEPCELTITTIRDDLSEQNADFVIDEVFGYTYNGNVATKTYDGVGLGVTGKPRDGIDLGEILGKQYTVYYIDENGNASTKAPVDSGEYEVRIAIPRSTRYNEYPIGYGIKDNEVSVDDADYTVADPKTAFFIGTIRINKITITSANASTYLTWNVPAKVDYGMANEEVEVKLARYATQNENKFEVTRMYNGEEGEPTEFTEYAVTIKVEGTNFTTPEEISIGRFILSDSAAPEFEFKQGNPAYIPVTDATFDINQFVNITDNFTAQKDIKIIQDGTVNLRAKGTYTVRITATDKAGNSRTETLTVIVTPLPPITYRVDPITKDELIIKNIDQIRESGSDIPVYYEQTKITWTEGGKATIRKYSLNYDFTNFDFENFSGGQLLANRSEIGGSNYATSGAYVVKVELENAETTYTVFRINLTKPSYQFYDASGKAGWNKFQEVGTVEFKDYTSLKTAYLTCLKGTRAGERISLISDSKISNLIDDNGNIWYNGNILGKVTYVDGNMRVTIGYDQGFDETIYEIHLVGKNNIELQRMPTLTLLNPNV